MTKDQQILATPRSSQAGDCHTCNCKLINKNLFYLPLVTMLNTIRHNDKIGKLAPDPNLYGAIFILPSSQIHSQPYRCSSVQTMRSLSESPLGSLSSPSPSPAPQSRPALSTKRALSPPAKNGAGLDSTSELSELTEEEQEVHNNNRDDIEQEEDDDTNANARRRPVRRGGGRRKRGGIVPAPMWHWYKAKKPASENGTSQPEEEEEEEEVAAPPRAMEEEEGEEEDDDDKDASIRPDSHPNGVEHQDDEDPASLASVNDDLQRVLGKRFPLRNADGRATQRQRIASQSQHAQDSEEEDDADLEDEEDDADAEEDGDVPRLNLDTGDADAGNDTESDVDGDVTLGEDALTNMVPMDVDRIIDIAAPATVTPALAVAASTSIMAGSSILASATPSPDSSLSESGESSRTGSPAAEKGDEEDDDDEEDDEEEDEDVTRREEEDDDADEILPSTIPVTEAKVAGEAGEADDAEAASALQDEIDLEIDADLQPAHRAEALDALATVELKFALLRERIYVEKMEGIAWEEALVADGETLLVKSFIYMSSFLFLGTHPELVYLHNELSRREAKRKDLASRQRAYDAACVSRKRKMDEDYIWGWWKVRKKLGQF